MVMLRALTNVFLFIITCNFPNFKLLSEIIGFYYSNHVLKLIKKYEKHDYRPRKINYCVLKQMFG